MSIIQIPRKAIPHWPSPGSGSNRRSAPCGNSGPPGSRRLFGERRSSGRIERPLIKFKKRGRERYEACDDEDGEMKKQEVSRSATSKRDDYVSEGVGGTAIRI